MTRSTDQKGVTSASRGGRWHVVTMVRISGVLLGAIVTVLAQADMTGASLEATLVSDAEIVFGHLSDELLATALVERTTSEQVASRQKGYLPVGAFSAIQTAAVRQIARHHGLLDEEGQPTESGTSLHIGIWQTWEGYVSTLDDGNVTWFRLDMPPRPPTVEAIARPPLADSVLRSSWPHPVPSSGVKGVLRSLEDAFGHGNEADGIGWHLRDLPLLYRNWMQEEWQRTVEMQSEASPRSLDPSQADVLWVKAILVSVMLQHEDGSGGGVEIVVPAF
ncbi:MAG: hypothetical protein JSV79_12845 [Armatimonadota bacterium]|nr:MAG: hypothetical protein JSV79_12845 [Armatimonadota bacterium]